MTERDYQLLLRIRNHCKEIYKFIERFGDDFSIFSNDSAYVSAVAMQIFQIGELSNHFTGDFVKKTQHEIPWRAIVDMRNLIGHEYKRMDEETVWDTIKNDLPELLDFSERTISEYNKEQSKAKQEKKPIMEQLKEAEDKTKEHNAKLEKIPKKDSNSDRARSKYRCRSN